MISGLYHSTAGASVQTAKNEMVANNLANLSTIGFKRQLAVFRERADESREHSVPPALLDPRFQAVGGGTALSELHTDYSEGNIVQTENPLNMAIEGHGFFAVTDGNETFYTRAGNFQLDADGYMVTNNGKYRLVNNSGGPIVLQNPGDVENWRDTYRQRVALFGFQNPGELNHVGEGLFRDSGNAGRVSSLAPGNVNIGRCKIGYVEKSNVNPVLELTAMIEGSRAYEANMKVIRQHDAALSRAVNDVGRVR